MDDRQPSAWVARWLGEPRGSRRLLDLACGSGRHVHLALNAGFDVTAVDRNTASLTLPEGMTCTVLEVDLENGRWTLPAGRFEVVIVTHYLFRPRLALTAGLVEPGGRLIYETFASGNAAYGRPSNPAFLLREDELFDACRRAGLSVVAFEQGYAARGRGAVLQRIVAARPPLGTGMALR
ncbi:MAG: class I SAM-dependent methyltransferase [Lautropia sp.]